MKHTNKIVMLNLIQHPHRLFSTRGFTLIELLVVVLIIGILAAVAVPQYQKGVTKAKAIQAISTLKALGTAQDIYYLENGTYTTDPSKLNLSFASIKWVGWAGTDVNSPNEYVYSCQPTGSCIANAFNKNLPMFQYDFSYFTHPQGAKKGILMCTTFGGKSNIAKGICEQWGEQQSDGTYYIMNVPSSVVQ